MADQTTQTRSWARIIIRIGVAIIIVAFLSFLWLSNLYFTQAFSQQQRSEAERQLSLYSSRLVAEIQRVSVVPQLLSREAGLISDLQEKNFSRTSQRLSALAEEIDIESVILADVSGTIVGSSNELDIGKTMRDQKIFIDALRFDATRFGQIITQDSKRRFFYARALRENNIRFGVILVEVAIEDLFTTWSGVDETLLLSNREGVVFLATAEGFLDQELEAALPSQPQLTALERAIQATGTNPFNSDTVDVYLEGEALYRLDSQIPFQAWRLTYLAPFQPIRDRVNAVLSLEIMGFAILAALTFYFLSRRAIRQSFILQAEGDELRALNERLSSEITQRERAEKNLEVAEASLEQSSKLAALGEMSAAVSHELNQPLAAMRTYLAGAKLLLGRNRPDEATASFQRIDDLIERMGLITKQLKSYARKGSDDFVPVNFNRSIKASLELMSPQLGQADIALDLSLPDEPAMVNGDPVRMEQVIVNLIRNAIDAMKGQAEKQLSIALTVGEMAVLTVQDNGPGIEELDELFEPFYTTKKPGDGLGLGLAISAGIAKDLDGRLFARNITPRGASFEFSLPHMKNGDEKAAE